MSAESKTKLERLIGALEELNFRDVDGNISAMITEVGDLAVRKVIPKEDLPELVRWLSKLIY